MWIRVIASIACLAAVSLPEFWDEKPWTEWSREETHRVLEKSPWVKTYFFSGNTIANQPGEVRVVYESMSSIQEGSDHGKLCNDSHID